MTAVTEVSEPVYIISRCLSRVKYPYICMWFPEFR